MGKSTMWFKSPVTMEADGNYVKVTGTLWPEGVNVNANSSLSDEEKISKICDEILGGIDLAHLEMPDEYYYSCLPLCLLDAIYSIGVNYAATRNVVERYCEEEGITKIRDPKTEIPSHESHRIDDLIKVIGESKIDIQNFADNIVKNHQMTSSRGGILKAEAVLKCAKVLQAAGVHTIQEFNSVAAAGGKAAEALEENFENVTGQKSGLSFAYLKMLCGDENTFKPDRHILNFLSDTLGYNVGKDEAKVLFPEVVIKLKEENPALTVRTLDYVIWAKARTQ